MRPLLLALLLLIAPLANAQGGKPHIQTFPLHHRNAAEMVELLRPMMPGLSLTGTGYTLVARGTLDELVELERMLRNLDTAPGQLMISVRQGGSFEGSREGGSVSGRIGRDGGDAGVRVYGTDRREHDRSQQQLRVMEGGWARIDAGQSVPLSESSVTYGPGGATVHQGYQYRDVGTGFEVRPRLNGSEVVLDIRPYNNRLSSSGRGAIDTQEIVTTVSGRLGEWIPLGGVSESSRQSASGITWSTGSRGEQTREVYVKVEKVQ